MPIVVESARPCDAPTEDDFVDAVIRTHARMRSQLRALLRGEAGGPKPSAGREEEVIGAYCRRHGVEPTGSPRRFAGGSVFGDV